MGACKVLGLFDFGTQRLYNNTRPKVNIYRKTLKQKTISITSFSSKSRLRSSLPLLLKGGTLNRKITGETLWLPKSARPVWLDGTLPGDRGFDPLGLSKPLEFIQFDLDELDQNNAVNKAGSPVGFIKTSSDTLSSQTLQPYSEVFGLLRFRECELIHGRWAMLASLGVLVAESATGISWVDAGKVELSGARYLNFELPFSISQLCWIEALSVGLAELYRNRELDTSKRLYPGGTFDHLVLATPGLSGESQVIRLREAEIKHCRLAMVSFFWLWYTSPDYRR